VILAHGEEVLLLPGWVCCLPLGAASVVYAVLARLERRTMRARQARGLAWILLSLDASSCIFVLVASVSMAGEPLTSELLWRGITFSAYYACRTTVAVDMVLSALALYLVRKNVCVDWDLPRCENCGYILIGLTELRCPECGKPFDPETLEDE
jgi:hypothetical protein